HSLRPVRLDDGRPGGLWARCARRHRGGLRGRVGAAGQPALRAADDGRRRCAQPLRAERQFPHRLGRLGRGRAHQRHLRRLLDAKLDCVLFMTNASPAAAIIERMNAAKYPGLFYASSFAGQDLIDMMVTRKQSCVLSVVVPRPNAAGVGIVAQCGRDLATHVPGAKVGTTTLEGYIAGRTAIAAARTVLKPSGSVTRGKLREALAGLHTDFGGYRVEFAAGSTQCSPSVAIV